eukprot:NODE_5481_length_648_cov_276.255278_g5317_i0.p2 GENE.NODE_5481_length_648_cov_276.255278_g5317_i0~~NODE_5481_length_648_cov_276.255278_g5317_i0.p2  ORF type:complete len:166 (+),score=41.52 NODE_5481_length_648_cov_276.255278_g5317_i0:51-548(+)
MPSYTAWTCMHAFGLTYMGYEAFRARYNEVAEIPSELFQAYHLKERWTRYKKMLLKYQEELELVDPENITPEDIDKFQLEKPTTAIAFWSQFDAKPHWQKLAKQMREEAREEVLSEHPAYQPLLEAYQAGGRGKVRGMDGPWMHHGFDDGLHGHFRSFNPIKKHH